LLLSIGPLASLAGTQEQLRDRLRELTPEVAPELQAAWQAAAEASLAAPPTHKRLRELAIPEQFRVLITCRDEKRQGLSVA
jgi:hypothetical protein